MDSKPLPSDPKTEAYLLGALMLGSASAMRDAIELLQPEYFSERRNVHTFEAMIKLYDKGISVDLISLVDRMRTDGTLKESGGPMRLTELGALGVSPGMVGGYAQILRDVYRRRCLVVLAATLHQEAHSETNSTESILARLDGESLRLAAMEGHKGYYELLEVLQELYVDKEAESRGTKGKAIATGFYDLDHLCSGMAPGELIILAARPSIGKTALALCTTLNICRAGGHVGMESLEMSRIAIASRCVKAGYGVADPGFNTIREYMERCQDYGFWIDDTPGLSMRVIGAKARTLRIKNKINVLVVDYLQLIQSDGKSKNRYEEVTRISLELKNLARELNIPILCLSQLNRECESRPDKRPQISDLRESGAIEQDADQVWLLHRPEKYGIMDAKDGTFNPRQEALVGFWKGRAEVIVDKNRNGTTGSAYLSWEPELTRFDNRSTVPASGSDNSQF